VWDQGGSRTPRGRCHPSPPDRAKPAAKPLGLVGPRPRSAAECWGQGGREPVKGFLLSGAARGVRWSQSHPCPHPCPVPSSSRSPSPSVPIAIRTLTSIPPVPSPVPIAIPILSPSPSPAVPPFPSSSPSCPHPCPHLHPCPHPCSLSCPHPCSLSCPHPCSLSCPQPCSHCHSCPVPSPVPISILSPSPSSSPFCPQPCPHSHSRPCPPLLSQQELPEDTGQSPAGLRLGRGPGAAHFPKSFPTNYSRSALCKALWLTPAPTAAAPHRPPRAPGTGQAHPAEPSLGAGCPGSRGCEGRSQGPCPAPALPSPPRSSRQAAPFPRSARPRQ